MQDHTGGFSNGIESWGRSSRQGSSFPGAHIIRNEGSSAMSTFHMGIAIYIVLGLLGYLTISGTGAGADGKRKPSLLRKAAVILLWPLAMIGAIED
jgi:hypothetical protein